MQEHGSLVLKGRDDMALVERIESVSVAELHELVQVHAVFVQLEERLAENRGVDDVDGQVVRVDERAAHEIGNGEADFLGFAFQDIPFLLCHTNENVLFFFPHL
ncbi:hypothetical protein EAI80_01055 [Catenibacterium sp. co_0103]|nr:hypothetical protein EAI80_01055 [Catenibacterium sp. co_0103]